MLSSRKDVEFANFTAVTNNFIHSLFIQRNVTLNVVAITQVSEHYCCRSYIETPTIYGTDAAASHLSNAY